MFSCLQREDYRTMTSGGAMGHRVSGDTAGSCFETVDVLGEKLGAGYRRTPPWDDSCRDPQANTLRRNEQRCTAVPEHVSRNKLLQR